MEYGLSRHAREEMQRRGISEEIVAEVLRSPEQSVAGYGGVEP